MEKEHKKEFTIIVNARKETWKEETIDYWQVVNLAYPPPHQPQEMFTVQYSNGPKENREGTLVAGQKPVYVKNEMVFRVTPTNQS
jgi:hypothetical protein